MGRDDASHQALAADRGGSGGGCPVLTFAITPELYVDDGEEALAAAVARKAARRGRRRRGGVPLELGSGEGEPGFWDGDEG